jgi:taurine dioxygenase
MRPPRSPHVHPLTSHARPSSVLTGRSNQPSLSKDRAILHRSLVEAEGQAMALTVSPITEKFGAKVTGLDFSRSIPDEMRSDLRNLLDTYGLLLFRGQPITADRQKDLVGSFGPVIDEVGNHRGWLPVSNVDPETPEGFLNSRLLFHQDYVQTPWPYPLLSLCAAELAGGVATTEFASCSVGYDFLTPSQRANFSSLRVMHAAEIATEFGSDRDAEMGRQRIPNEAAPGDYLRTIHPMIKRHPRTGVPLLYVTELFASHVVGLEEDESESCLAEAFEVLYRGENVYSHHWELSDLLVWDNIRLQHARGPVESTTRRTLRRVCVSYKSLRDMISAANGSDADSLLAI